MDTEIFTKAFQIVKPRKAGKNNGNPFTSLVKNSWYSEYKKTWTRFHADFMAILKKKLVGLCNDVSTYLRDEAEYPNICLLCELNASDASMIFETLTTLLKSEKSYLIIEIDQFEDLNLKYLLERTIQMLVAFPDVYYDGINNIDGDNNDGQGQFNKRYKKFHFTFLKLRHICETIMQEKHVKPSIVYAFNDLTCIPRGTINDFVAGLRGLSYCANISVIFGIAGSFQNFFKVFPDKLLQSYELKFFNVQLGTLLIEDLIEQIFFNGNTGFLLHGTILEDLIYQFDVYDSSFNNFLSSIQAYMINHFYESPVSFLCCCTQESISCKKLEKIDVSELLQLKSVRNLNSRLKASGNAMLVEGPNVKEAIKKYLMELYIRISRFHLTVRCLHSLGSFMPCPKLNSIKSIYCQSMKQNLSNCENVIRAVRRVQFLSRETLLQSMQKLLNLLSSSNDGEMNSVKEEIEHFRIKIETCENEKSCRSDDDFLQTLDINGDSTDNDPTDTDVKSSRKNPASILIGQSRSDFFKKLQNNAQSCKKSTSELDLLKQQYTEFLINDFFSVFLECPLQYPFNELFIYQCIPESKSITNVNITATFKKALTHPSEILKCQCCTLEENEISRESWPDICISYQLLTEHGLDINLLDWLQSFDFKSRGEKEDDHIPPEIFHRFMQTVTDLNFLGYIKHHPWKVDHVRKLYL